MKSKKADVVNEESTLVPPDGGWAWVIAICSFWANFINDGVTLCMGLVIVQLAEVFEEPMGKVAWVSSINIAMQLISAPIASALSNRFGYRIVMISGSVLGCIGLVASAFVRSVTILFVTIGGICGIAFGLVFMPAIVGVSYYFSTKKALATGIAQCGTGIGIFVFAPFTTWLLETFGLSGTFLIFGGVYLNCAVLGSLYRPLESLQKNKPISAVTHSLLGDGIPQVDQDAESFLVLTDEQSFEMKAVDSPKTAAQNKKRPLLKLSLFKSPTFVLICASDFLSLLGALIPYFYLAAHAVQQGISEEAASFLVAMIGISSSVGKLFFGWIADHPKVSVLLMNNVSLTVSGLLTLAFPFLNSYTLLSIASVLFGLSGSCNSVIHPVLLGQLLGMENVNDSFGLVIFFAGIACLVGSPIAGFLYDTFNNYLAAFYFSGSSVLLAGILCYPLGALQRWESKRNKQKMAS